MYSDAGFHCLSGGRVASVRLQGKVRTVVELFGRDLTRRELAAHAGALSQFAGVRLMTLGDGLERGVRMLEFRSGTGLRFTVLVDRAMDIADCEYKGLAIGWHSPSGFRNPALHEYEGEDGLGWLRSFSGLMNTCGLDHILGADEAPADQYLYPRKKFVTNTIHGRISTVPARLGGYGERWDGDRCFLWCEGTASQATVFGEDLHLTRRIEIEVGTNVINLHDEVANRGFYRTPHMLMYHIDVGYPLVDEGSRYLAPIADVVWAGHAGDEYRRQGVGYRRCPAPRPDFVEQVWAHDLSADPQGLVPVALVNDRIGLGFQVVTRKDQFPCMLEWQNFQAGLYTLGIEPATHHVLGAKFARERDEMIWLEGGATRRYDTSLAILDGAADIARCEAAIRKVGPQPDDDYPEPSFNYRPLGKR
jgi:hypothetical protein